ncbi:hypothetical protein C1645_814147 [Glomus cerebriforme]|uniref:Uncharacterized protein n=1 Tax=Glomus cerebriforme TaxID=658196 RepID=A0A397TGP9_9GLOM|nr:hypothetical protein C1645_814147 [Glomus cerebriforme]
MKKSVLNNEVISNYSNIEEDTQNLDENFNEMHLNSHKFVKNNDSYIEDKVYDTKSFLHVEWNLKV